MITSLVLLSVVQTLLLLASYWFLQQQGFDPKSFIVVSIMFLAASAFAGYIILSDIAEQKEEQDSRLMHMVKETLHEINLPIATIDANISMLKKALASTKDIKRVERIEAALLRLRRLYGELSYNIKKEIMPIQKQVFDLAELIEERVDIFKEHNRGSFEVQTEPCMIYVDKIGLEGAIDNIIENAVKHSGGNKGIEIVIKDSVLYITDNGDGIDADDLIKIYDRYYQGNKGSKGEGIGLALVKRYCDKESIRIKIDSSLSVGTTVSLDFSRVTVE